MEQQIVAYFTAEKAEALLFMLVGITAVVLSLWLLRRGGAYKAMAYPLLAIAAIQLVVGSTVYFRTDTQLAALSAQYAGEPLVFKAEETVRMNEVVRNFVIYRYIEMALLVTGILLMLGLRHKARWHAVGIGLAVQSALMLLLDYFAEARADEYLRFVLTVPAG